MEYSVRKPPIFLEYGDEVIFNLPGKEVRYRVQTSYLQCTGYSNDRIFRDLDIKQSRFLEKAYGYNPYGGDWMEFNPQDYKAATRAVWLLFGEIFKLHPQPFLNLDDVIDPRSISDPMQEILNLDHWGPIKSEMKQLASVVSGYDIEHLLVIR